MAIYRLALPSAYVQFQQQLFFSCCVTTAHKAITISDTVSMLLIVRNTVPNRAIHGRTIAWGIVAANPTDKSHGRLHSSVCTTHNICSLHRGFRNCLEYNYTYQKIIN